MNIPQSEWNRIIAERCGWRLIKKGEKNPPPVSFRLCPICNYVGSRHRGHEGMGCDHESEWVASWNQFTKDGDTCQDYPPDYIGSLDAMAQAEAALSNTNHYKFRCALWNIATKNNKSITGWPQNRAYTSATALQRAEAFIIATNPTGENE